MAAIRGQQVLGHPRPSPPACFGSNKGFKSSLVTAETGGSKEFCRHHLLVSFRADSELKYSSEHIVSSNAHLKAIIQLTSLTVFKHFKIMPNH